MLLSVAEALDSLETSRFDVHDTAKYPDAQPLYSDDWPIGITVMRTTLTADMEDKFTGDTHPAGTIVYAPLAVCQFEQLPGAPVRQAGSSSSPPLQTSVFGTRAWVFCCHDHPDLASARQAYFYHPDVLESICLCEARMTRPNRRTFDPITYGSGEVAFLSHPSAREVIAAQRDAARDSWVRTRGPDAHQLAALMGSTRVFDDHFTVQPLSTLPAVIMVRLLRSSSELACMRRRLWTAILRLPRAPGSRLAENPNALGDGGTALLPMGAPVSLCTEGSVVQSDAAWSLRRDWRVRKMMFHQLSDPPEDWLMMDQPLVCFTGASARAHFLRDAPVITLHRGPRFGVKRRGVFGLGWGPIPIWTLPPGAQVPEALLVNLPEGPGIRGVTALPVAFRVMSANRGSARGPVATPSRAELYDKLAAVGVTRARVEFTFPGGHALQLDYVSCHRGWACALDAVVQPLIDLPAMEVQPTGEVTLGVTLALATAELSTLAASMHTRIVSGQCPDTDIYGNSIRVPATGDPTEQLRLRNLRPADAPYTTQNPDPWLWDPRQQNPIHALPHVYAHASIGLMEQLNQLH